MLSESLILPFSFLLQPLLLVDLHESLSLFLFLLYFQLAFVSILLVGERGKSEVIIFWVFFYFLLGAGVYLVGVVLRAFLGLFVLRLILVGIVNLDGIDASVLKGLDGVHLMAGAEDEALVIIFFDSLVVHGFVVFDKTLPNGAPHVKVLFAVLVVALDAVADALHTESAFLFVDL